MAISHMDVSFTIPNISKLDEIWLPAVTVQGIEWKVTVSKNKVKKSLSAYIHCASEDANWSYAAQYSIKILSSKLNLRKQLDMQPHVFDSTTTNMGFSSFIEWNNLLDEKNGYVENDTINLEISVDSVYRNDPRKSHLTVKNTYQSCEENCRAIFQLTIKNVDRLLAVKTPLFNKKYLPCTLTVFKDRDDNVNVRLHSKCKPSNKTVHIKLVTSVDSTQHVKIISIRPSSQEFQRQKLISWTDLVKPDNGFIKNNLIIIIVEFVSDDFNDTSTKSIDSDSKSTIKQLECAICFEIMEDRDISSLICGHLFCTVCIKTYVNDHGVCPLCQKLSIVNDLRRIYLPMISK